MHSCVQLVMRRRQGEFCWICMGSWADHGTNTGGFYKCNRFAEKPTEGMSDVARAKVRCIHSLFVDATCL
jgi:hypothetical protein